MFGRNKKQGRDRSWILLLLTFFGAKTLIKKFNLDK